MQIKCGKLNGNILKNHFKRRNNMKLQEVMTTHLVTVNSNNTVLDAAKIMQAHNIGCVPVCDQNGKVLGIVTDRDIVVRNIANNGDPKTTPIHTIMTTEVIEGNPIMDVDTAVRIMAEHKIRRLPVIENDRLVGMVALGDLATRYRYIDEAGQALSEISEPSRPANIIQ